MWIKDRQTGMVMGFFFVCPVCPPILMGLLPHPILIYTDPLFAQAQGHGCWTMVGKSFSKLSVLGPIRYPRCEFDGWISKGEVRWNARQG